MQVNPNIKSALVSTNSITQGSQVPILWKPLIEKYNISIDFAWRTFRWDNGAKDEARVHCVIIGFSNEASTKNTKQEKHIFTADCLKLKAKNINGYLIDADNVFIVSKNKPICKIPSLFTGSQRIDDDNYIFTDKEKDDFLKKEPNAAKYFHIWYGGDEFIYNRPRWVLYLGNCTPKEIKELPLCMERARLVKEYRLASDRKATVKAADTPHRFGLEVIPDIDFMVIPVVSSEKREYVPIGFLSPDKMCSNQVNLIPGANLYHFGILTSSVHNVWLQTVCGRLEMRFRYSKGIVYNNFPWPENADEQRIEKTAQAILDARALYPDSSLADLYDELTMPIELRKAHAANDRAVMEAYGFKDGMSVEAIVGELFKMYEKLTSKQPETKRKRK